MVGHVKRRRPATARSESGVGREVEQRVASTPKAASRVALSSRRRARGGGRCGFDPPRRHETGAGAQGESVALASFGMPGHVPSLPDRGSERYLIIDSGVASEGGLTSLPPPPPCSPSPISTTPNLVSRGVIGVLPASDSQDSTAS